MNIVAQTIPHKNQRYNSVGDYYIGVIGYDTYNVSRMNNPAYELAVLAHELVEFDLCKKAGISEESVTKFDIEFETGRCVGEPGDDPGCPYRAAHQAASSVERAVIAAMGENWEVYEKRCEEITNGKD